MMSGAAATDPWTNGLPQNLVLDEDALLESPLSQGYSPAPSYDGLSQPLDTHNYSFHQRSQWPRNLPRTHNLHGPIFQNPEQQGYTVPALGPQPHSARSYSEIYPQAAPFPQHNGFAPQLFFYGALQPAGYDQNVMGNYGVPPWERSRTFQGFVPQPRMVEFTEYPPGSGRSTFGGQTFEGYPAPRYIPQDSPEHPLGPMNAADPGYGQNGCPRPRSQGCLVSPPLGPPSRHADFGDSKFQRNNGAVPYSSGSMNNSRLPTRPLAAKHIRLPSARKQAVRTQPAVNESHRTSPSMVTATTRGTGLYTNEMNPTQKRRRRTFSDIEKARIREVRKAGACPECKPKKRRCTHVATSTSTDQLSPPRATSEIGDSVSPGSTQTSNAIQSSPDTILEEIDHDGTDFDFQYDSAFRQLFPEGTAYSNFP